MKPGTIFALAFAVLFPLGIFAFVASPDAIRWAVAGLLAIQRLPGGPGLIIVPAVMLGLVGTGLAVRSVRKRAAAEGNRDELDRFL